MREREGIYMKEEKGIYWEQTEEKPGTSHSHGSEEPADLKICKSQICRWWDLLSTSAKGIFYFHPGKSTDIYILEKLGETNNTIVKF